MRKAKRGLLSTAKAAEARPVQTLAVDNFKEISERKREAEKKASKQGHDLGHWRKRPNDEFGRQDSYCRSCLRVATVCVEKPSVYNLPFVYGNALDEGCTPRNHYPQGRRL